MAISLPTQIGAVSGNFWKTDVIYISPDYSHSRMTMALYTSQAAYLSGAAALYQNDYLVPNLVNKNQVANLLEKGLIALSPQFAGGTVVSGV